MIETHAIISALPNPGPDEFCFLWINWWATCMTKSEWSGWWQAVGSILALIVAIGLAMWSRFEDRKAQTRAIEEQLRQYEQKKREARATGERFLILTGASIKALQLAFDSSGDKSDVLLRGAVVTEALAIARAVDFNLLDSQSESTILAAISVCSQVEVLINEERASQAKPPFQILKRFMPHYSERLREITSAWDERRYLRAPLAGAADSAGSEAHKR
ncbi:hypothetical protein DelCs14_3266 [Delftia sp. Cs1-4]|uniref:hypothetical protein n=1 Tax=Delftia sp. (strain Cs1-4) TaxID=742013 RepID=UPI00020E831D|nr:hypothetical protein [Delftia sp. Cs1-4]AEF90265.1 hypothetical protein DelCs14_3266 [Delftia sp. Cs1-4]